jgi:hypothetical protein
MAGASTSQSEPIALCRLRVSTGGAHRAYFSFDKYM